MKKILLSLFGGVLASSMAHAALICPTTVNTNSDCGYILTIAANGTVTGAPVGGANPYDGSDDALVGIINNMTTAFTGNIPLSGSGNGGGIFAFDSDGICTFTNAAYCGNAPTGYEGPINTFTGINGAGTAGTVHVVGLAGNGGTTFFSLEGSPASIVVTTGAPEPASLALIGTGLGALYFIRRRRSVN